MLAAAGVLGIVGMFWLKTLWNECERDEAFYTFLSISLATPSPWENLALLLQNYDNIDFQGLAQLSAISMSLSFLAVAGSPSMVLNPPTIFTGN